MLLSNEPRQGVQAPGHAGGGGVFVFFLFDEPVALNVLFNDWHLCMYYCHIASMCLMFPPSAVCLSCFIFYNIFQVQFRLTPSLHFSGFL